MCEQPFRSLVVTHECKCEPFDIEFSDVSAGAFWHEGLVPCMVECKCCAFLTLVDGCECWAFLTGLWEVFPHGQM